MQQGEKAEAEQSDVADASSFPMRADVPVRAGSRLFFHAGSGPGWDAGPDASFPFSFGSLASLCVSNSVINACRLSICLSYCYIWRPGVDAVGG